MSYSVPILLIFFNRPDNAEKLINRLRLTKPIALFVAVDGPRTNNLHDRQNVEKCIQLLDTIDWPCEVYRKVAPVNLGCGLNVSEAISWFFSHVNEGIILEDDCLPSEAFFTYCQTLLPVYRDVPSVMLLSGNRWNDEFPIETDYFFSMFTSTWGWATWKRAWMQYDYTMHNWGQLKDDIAFIDWLKTPPIKEFWISQLDKYYNHIRRGIDNWDFQLQYTVFKHKGLVVTPRQNLVQNIGIEGVHTNSAEQGVHFKSIAETFQINNVPKELSPDYKYDSYHCEKLLINRPTFFDKVFYTLKQLMSFNINYVFRKITNLFC